MRALLFERSLPRYAAARVAGSLAPGLGARVGPLTLTDVDEPDLPGPDWHRVRPRLAGICGSDLATIDGKSSRYFEPVVSFPFVPGHEVVGELSDGSRVVVEPVLGCVVRAIDPPCAACAAGRADCCERIAFGEIEPGMQTGYCSDTGGGWSTGLVAHESQLHRVPAGMSDEAAVMVEPAACAIHGVVNGAGALAGGTVVVLGAGTLGLCAVAALRRYNTAGTVLAVAKYPEQRDFAADLGADVVVKPEEAQRAVRRTTGSLKFGGRLAGGADVVIDCVGTESSVGEDLAMVKPGGLVVLLGMPSVVTVDLTPLWQRQITLRGSYAYGVEPGAANGSAPPRTFDLAFDLVVDARLDRLVSALYALDRYREAIDHAANAGRRGAVKVAFDLRGEKRR